MELFILPYHLWVPTLNSFYVILEMTMIDYAFFLEIDSYLQACNEKEKKVQYFTFGKGIQPRAERPSDCNGFERGCAPSGWAVYSCHAPPNPLPLRL